LATTGKLQLREDCVVRGVVCSGVDRMTEGSMCPAPVINCMHATDQFPPLLINHRLKSSDTVSVHFCGC